MRRGAFNAPSPAGCWDRHAQIDAELHKVQKRRAFSFGELIEELHHQIVGADMFPARHMFAELPLRLFL
jgi:hypothetical protein